MNEKAYKVFPLKRITAGIYDFFLLLGVWFAVGSIALWLNGGETLNPWLGPATDLMFHLRLTTELLNQQQTKHPIKERSHKYLL